MKLDLVKNCFSYLSKSLIVGAQELSMAQDESNKSRSKYLSFII